MDVPGVYGEGEARVSVVVSKIHRKKPSAISTSSGPLTSSPFLGTIKSFQALGWHRDSYCFKEVTLMPRVLTESWGVGWGGARWGATGGVLQKPESPSGRNRSG